MLVTLLPPIYYSGFPCEPPFHRERNVLESQKSAHYSKQAIPPAINVQLAHLLPLPKGSPFLDILISGSSGVHCNPSVPFPILPNASRTTRTCISTFAQRPSSYPSRCFAAYAGEIPKKWVRLGAGRDTPGAPHHSYVQGLKVVKEGTRCTTSSMQKRDPGGCISIANDRGARLEQGLNLPA